MINNVPKISNISNKKTKELVKEMYYSLTNKTYPCYSASMLLFRPILNNIAHDISGKKTTTLNYYQIIILIYDNSSINIKFKNDLLNMKRVVDDINHNHKVVFDDDVEDVILC